jgi:hypothetical protein
MKKALSNVGAVLMGSLVVVGMFAAIMHATSAEVWYAGEHTEGCNGSLDCGCYKKLLELDKANIQNPKSGKR